MQENPLLGITIGSTINAGDLTFYTSVVEKPVSQVIKQAASSKFMSGESNYVYTERMNQGMLGMAGSYGVSGISKFEASISAYVGNASAMSSKSVFVHYNAQSVAGIEYIDFDNLTASEFLAALKASTQQSATDVLDAYNNVMQEVAALGVDLATILSSNDAKYDKGKELANKWVKLSETFTNECGDGLVVGIIWGSFGAVSMEMSAKNSVNTWKYGGNADFSYSGLAASVTVKATYDGGQAGKNADVDVRCTSFVSGSILESQINAWFNKVSDKSFAELADVKVLDQSPNMDISNKWTPKIPDFQKPLPSAEIKNKVEQIKELNNLPTFAQKSAYEAAKKTNASLTWQTFLTQSQQQANISGLTGLIDNIKTNKIDTLKFDGPSKKITVVKDATLAHSGQTTSIVEGNADDSSGGCVPLGVWICNWANLLPWLAQGYLNNISTIDNIQAIKDRVMMQDYHTLSRVYYTAHSAGIIFLKRNDPFSPTFITLDVANAFANAVAKMQEGKESVESIFNGLGTVAQEIYRQWNKMAFLRNCELGMGVIRKGDSLQTIQGGENDPSQNVGFGSRAVCKLGKCSFDGNNYSAFSRFLKVLPLVTPDGEVLAIGPEKGALSLVYEKEFAFTDSSNELIQFLTFVPDSGANNGNTLINRMYGLQLFPLPFSAAANIEWKGQSVSTNISSMKALSKNLDTLQDELRQSTAWTFSSADWSTTWKGTDAYRQRNIKKQYIGLIDKVGNIL